MRGFWLALYRSLRRVFPRCITQSQAVAFNMLLALFPMLLVALGVLAHSVGLRSAVSEMSARLSHILPSPTELIVTQFLQQHGSHALRWALAGLGGTLLAGMQAMRLTIEGFSIAHGSSARWPARKRHKRAFFLLLTMIVPFLLTVVLTVFGKLVRAWMIHHYGMPGLIQGVWFAVYVPAGLALLMFVLAVVYRLGEPGERTFREVLPGAVLATLLLWAANGALGFYVRHMPYSLVYGGLAGAVGLAVWMQLTATILFLGAAFNVEYTLRR